jgi:integrase
MYRPKPGHGLELFGKQEDVMARRTRAPKIENRTTRLKLAVRRKPYFAAIAPGISLGYRRNLGAGVWVVRGSDGHGANWTKRFAVADDHEESNEGMVLNFWQAQDRAREIARGTDEAGRPASVAEALDAYQANLAARGGLSGNATRVRGNIPSTLAAKTVSLLTAKELRAWRDGLVSRGMTPSAADRNGRALKAALNLAAADDARITNGTAWETGLARLPDAETSRNVILPDDTVRALIAAAYEVDAAFGLLVEVVAVTGARFSQLARVRVDDLQDGDAPRLMVPGSFKGKKRRSERKPLPIPTGLAHSLQQHATGRADADPLLVREDGVSWPELDREMFRAAAEKVGLDETVTPYALRHSSIVRQLLAGVPTRVVASAHDTSVPMLEKTYSRHIVGDPADALIRKSLLDTAAPAAGNVVPIGGRK